MNTTLTISLPKKEAQYIKKTAKRLGYASVSRYMRERAMLLEDLSDVPILTTEEILKSSKEADRLYKQGKLPILKSLADLIDA